MNTRESPNHEQKNAILLEQSGERTAAEREAPHQTHTDRPDLSDWAMESRVLQAASQSATEILSPPLPELNRTRILKAASQPASKTLPRLLALAAILVLALGLLPHLSRHLQSPPPSLTTRIQPVQTDFDSRDPLLDDLDALQEQLAVWSNLSMEDSRILEDENDWAEILLSMEEPI
ncbi:MAG: hypothetical protein WD708_10205 [Kiritimatiellia bacterium]